MIINESERRELQDPPIPSETDRRYREAREEVAALKAFYIHVAVFVVVMIGLFAIDYGTGGDWWAHWPLLGWGIGILGHAVGVFTPIRFLGREWEERKVREHMQRSGGGPRR